MDAKIFSEIGKVIGLLDKVSEEKIPALLELLSKTISLTAADSEATVEKLQSLRRTLPITFFPDCWPKQEDVAKIRFLDLSHLVRQHFPNEKQVFAFQVADYLSNVLAHQDRLRFATQRELEALALFHPERFTGIVVLDPIFFEEKTRNNKQPVLYYEGGKNPLVALMPISIPSFDFPSELPSFLWPSFL